MKQKQYFCCVCWKEYKKQNSIQKTCRKTCQLEYEKQRREEKSKKLSIRISWVDKDENRLEIRKHIENFMPSLLGTKQVTIKVSRWKLKTDLKKLEEKCDDLWSLVVKKLAFDMCIYCGDWKTLNSHHIFGRANRSTRWDELNGACLCANHHQFSTKFSAHGTPALFREWYIDFVWQKYFEDLEERANRPMKVSVEFLEDKIEYLKKLLSEQW